MHTKLFGHLFCISHLLIAFHFVFVVVAECRMNLWKSQSCKLSMNLLSIPTICEMTLSDLGDSCSCPLNEGNAPFIKFNKRPCAWNHSINSALNHKSNT